MNKLSIGKVEKLRKQLWLEAYANTCQFKKACEIVGVPVGTVYKWMRQDPVFCRSMERVVDATLPVIESVVLEDAINGGVESAKWLLTKLMPTKYGNRSEVVVEHGVRFAGAGSTDEVRKEIIKRALPDLMKCDDWHLFKDVLAEQGVVLEEPRTIEHVPTDDAG